ncbi:TatD family hydrolase [Thermofilum pendens]|uniref:Hydrolase, TatD family n=1 Tax=Thermofilum pendens (strain DSM 2475 / Hrk 5) TaxID=368408 RepID=A1RWE8_THEPD|nr:TatD family hydrolase [Thermofilum pendens]ABL77528.1 hydrolase, TatD family [Thermofilum pendens Hrk 5]
MIDAHCHLTYPGLKERVENVLAEARRALKAVVTSGLPYDAEKSPGFPGAKEALALSERYRGFVFVTLGLHPTQVPEMSDEEVAEYINFIEENRDRIVGIGEIGLDKYWLSSEDDLKRAREVFLSLLEVAEKLGKPVVIHSRKAEEEAVEILSSYSLDGRVLLHSFTGNMTTAKKALDMGYFFSINYKVTNTKSMRKIAKTFPLESILTETDSPFLSHEAGVNTPLQVRLILEEISRLRGLGFEEVDAITTRNAVSFFGLEKQTSERTSDKSLPRDT